MKVENGKWEGLRIPPEVSANFSVCTAAPQAPLSFHGERKRWERTPVGKPRCPDTLPDVGLPRQSNYLLQTRRAKMVRLTHTRLCFNACVAISAYCRNLAHRSAGDDAQVFSLCHTSTQKLSGFRASGFLFCQALNDCPSPKRGDLRG